MPKWSLMYFGLLIALAFLVAPNAHSDEYRCRGKKCRYYAAPDWQQPVEKICKDKVRGLGIQWLTEDGALEKAKDDWRSRVRYDLGESYLDLTNAEDFEKRCGRTSIGEVAGQTFSRCEIIARPCKGIFSKLEGQK